MGFFRIFQPGELLPGTHTITGLTFVLVMRVNVLDESRLYAYLLGSNHFVLLLCLQVPLRPGRMSPATLISPPDSSGSMFNTTSSLGSSRGSSPLTLGMADVIPMAVAFTENINANFKGTDATK